MQQFNLFFVMPQSRIIGEGQFDKYRARNRERAKRNEHVDILIASQFAASIVLKRRETSTEDD